MYRMVPLGMSTLRLELRLVCSPLTNGRAPLVQVGVVPDSEPAQAARGAMARASAPTTVATIFDDLFLMR